MVVSPINHIELDDRGVAFIAKTRIKVSNIAVARNVWKRSADAIQMDYPQLSLAQIHAAIAYYCDNQDIVDAEILSAQRLGEKLRGETSNPLNRETYLHYLAAK